MHASSVVVTRSNAFACGAESKKEQSFKKVCAGSTAMVTVVPFVAGQSRMRVSDPNFIVEALGDGVAATVTVIEVIDTDTDTDAIPDAAGNTCVASADFRFDRASAAPSPPATAATGMRTAATATRMKSVRFCSPQTLLLSSSAVAGIRGTSSEGS